MLWMVRMRVGLDVRDLRLDGLWVWLVDSPILSGSFRGRSSDVVILRAWLVVCCLVHPLRR